MRIVNIDTTSCSTPDQLHEVLRQQLDFPAYYGKNLDALWDCLTGWVQMPLTVEWCGIAEARQTIGDYVDKVLETFQQAEQEVEGFKIIVR
jgi:ribonuclease inhibitor